MFSKTITTGIPRTVCNSGANFSATIACGLPLNYSSLNHVVDLTLPLGR